jgi:hypothetical protein
MDHPNGSPGRLANSGFCRLSSVGRVVGCPFSAYSSGSGLMMSARAMSAQPPGVPGNGDLSCASALAHDGLVQVEAHRPRWHNATDVVPSAPSFAMTDVNSTCLKKRSHAGGETDRG